MRRCDMAGGSGKCLAVGAALIMALAGCSKSGDDDDSNTMGANAAGAAAPGAPAPGNSMMPGSNQPPSNPGTSNQPGTAGSAPAAGGKGGDVMNPGTAGSGMPSDMTPGGTAGSGDDMTPDQPMDNGVCDTSSFLADCMQGGDAWGTPQQSGPCKSGISTYGVKTEFGPYGVRSKYNVGKGFETGGTDDSTFCNTVFIPSFGADPKGSMDLMNTHDLDYGLFTVFYPGCMPEGEKFPVITWGNGTCAMPEGYGPLLRYVASFGYIVIAANNREVAGGAPMLKGLDFMTAENEKADSEFYHHVDTDKFAAMGHSQGGMATISAADDPRIKAVIIWNGGTSASKPFLAVSGDRDLGGTAAQMKNSAEAAPRPAAWLWYHQIPAAVNGSTTGDLAPGHLTLMMESERVIKPAVAWWDLILKGKDDAKKMFLGTDCTLCDPQAFKSMWSMETGPSLEYGHNDMLK